MTTVRGILDTETAAQNAVKDCVTLQCLACNAPLGALTLKGEDASSYDCSRCRHKMVRTNGIWHSVPAARLAYFSHFIDDYQQIRAAEGRGSLDSEFYRQLPYKDVSGKNRWQWQIRARTYDHLRKEVLSPIFNEMNYRPRVLDIGAGNGWMSYRLALDGYLPVAADLLINDLDGLGAAVHFSGPLGSLFPRVRAEMSRLPFAAEQFDAIVFNASFHYAENYHSVLREAFRCVRSGGRVVIADTPWYSSESAGQQMLAERRVAFSHKFGVASDSIRSLEYLTDERLRGLECALNIQWEQTTPNYGLEWALRPLVAKLRGKREPSRFRIYSARKAA
jgi:SAM-dependent methyltransferase